MSVESVLTLIPNGLSVISLISLTDCFISSNVCVAVARKPIAPAEDVAAVSLAVETHPIPV